MAHMPSYFATLTFCLAVWTFFYMTKSHIQYPDENWNTVFFKVLPMLQLIFMCMCSFHPSPEFPRYRNHVILGLCASIGGDICLVWRKSMFIYGLLSFAAAQFIYARGFGPQPQYVFSGLTCLAAAFGVYGYISYGIPPEEGASTSWLVLIYVVLIFCMLWRAWDRFQAVPSFGTFCGFLGAISFVVSDVIIGVDKWKFNIDNAYFYIISTYFFAQLGITHSVVDFSPLRPVAIKEKVM